MDHFGRVRRARSSRPCASRWWSRRRSTAASLKPVALHLAADVDHFIEARRDQAGEADDVDIFLAGAFQNRFARHHHAQVDHFKVVAAEHDADDVLADVVDVAFDRREQHLGAGLLRCAGSRPFRLP